MNGIAASDKIFKILDLPTQQQGTETLSLPCPITLEHVDFQYDESRSILKDISLQIQPQQFIGIVGESGSGKSTIAKLIMGYHRYQKGNLYIGKHQRYEINDHDL